MKKCLVILLALMLTGCGTAPTFETVGEIQAQTPQVEAQQILMMLPDEAENPIRDGKATFYQCDGYTLTLQTLEGGDLSRTLKTVTGMEKENLELLQTECGPVKNYYCVWTAAGDPGLQIGRTRILDDGQYHYAVTAMAEEKQAGRLRETWENMFASVRLADPSIDFNTGS